MITTFGTACVDRIRRVSEWPKKGGYAEIEQEVSLLGGEAANTAKALATWGASVTLVANPVGNDENGQLVVKELSELGLSIHHEDDVVTPLCDIFVTQAGDRTMFGRGFAHLSEASFDLFGIGNSGWFTADSNPGQMSRRAAQVALDHGLSRYLMDFLWDEDEFLPGDFWQSSTDSVGTPGNTQKNVQWVQDFVSKFGCFTILSDGPNGFVAGSSDQPARAYPPFPAPEIVDFTGAGDAFRAGMLFGLDSGWEISRCLEFASASGCLACGYLGGTGGPASVEAIDAHVRRHAGVSRQYR